MLRLNPDRSDARPVLTAPLTAVSGIYFADPAPQMLITPPTWYTDIDIAASAALHSHFAASYSATRLVVSGEPEKEALGRRRPLEVLGVPLFVASPDDLLIYKLIAARPQDLVDIDRLIRSGRVPEDEPYVRRWAKEWEVEELFDRALEAARRTP